MVGGRRHNNPKPTMRLSTSTFRETFTELELFFARLITRPETPGDVTRGRA